MRRTVTLAASLLLAGPAYAVDDDAIVQGCAAEWGNDFKMVKYCREQQRTAGQKVDALRFHAGSNPTAKTILEACEAEWSTDYRMVVYCFEQQAEALSKLAVPASGLPKDVYEMIAGDCSGEWGTDFQMVAYCIDQQSTAWKELQ